MITSGLAQSTKIVSKTPNSHLSYFKLRSFKTSHFKLHPSPFKLRYFKLQTSSFTLQTSNFILHPSNFKLLTSNFTLHYPLPTLPCLSASLPAPLPPPVPAQQPLRPLPPHSSSLGATTCATTRSRSDKTFSLGSTLQVGHSQVGADLEFRDFGGDVLRDVRRQTLHFKLPEDKLEDASLILDPPGHTHRKDRHADLQGRYPLRFAESRRAAGSP